MYSVYGLTSTNALAVALIVGIIFGPKALNLFNPCTWGNVDNNTLELSRIEERLWGWNPKGKSLMELLPSKAECTVEQLEDPNKAPNTTRAYRMEDK